MKKKILYLSLTLTILLILTGCSERALTFDRVYPDTTTLDESREKRQLEIEEEIKSLPKRIKEESPIPRALIIYEPIPKTEETEEQDIHEKYADASQYCWDDNYLDCDTRMKPIHPYDNSAIYLSSARLDNNTRVKISVDAYRGSILPYPTRIEVYYYDQNKNLQLYQTVDKETVINEFLFTLPSEPGRYIFQFKVFYKEDVHGISYHPFLFFVK